jgi:hypothetical protein
MLAAGHEGHVDSRRPLAADVAQTCILVVLKFHDVSVFLLP